MPGPSRPRGTPASTGAHFTTSASRQTRRIQSRSPAQTTPASSRSTIPSFRSSEVVVKIDHPYMVRQGPLPPLGPMTEPEAAFAVKQIRRSLMDARRQLLDFDERKGWAALGHNTMAECAESVFGWTLGHFRRVLDAAQTERNIIAPVGTV